MKDTDSAAHKGYDAGKKVSGIKRHIVVDTLGLPHAWAVTTANVADRAGALEALQANRPSLGLMVNILADEGSSGEPFADKVNHLLNCEMEITLRTDKSTAFKP